jgi:molecular chaperone GrpE
LNPFNRRKTLHQNPKEGEQGSNNDLDPIREEEPLAPEVEAAAEAGAPEESPANLRAEIEKLTAERQASEDQVLRTMAEFQNFRRRKEQESEQLRLFANEKLVTSLLPVLDNFERTVAALENGAPIESVVEGIKLVDRQFRSILESNNVRRIESQGQPFDPDFHEAISAEESHELPENTVVSEVEPGYRLADKVIRPARVRVSKKP